MVMNDVVKLLLKIMSNSSAHPKVGKFVIKYTDIHHAPYSSNVIKPTFDIFDVFTDLLKYKHKDLSPVDTSIRHLNTTGNGIKSDKEMESLTSADIQNTNVAGKRLANELATNMRNKKWPEVNKILQFYIEKHVPLPNDLTLTIARYFAHNGFKEGLVSLRELCEITNKDNYLRNGELLHYMARCHWIRGNVVECIKLLTDCHYKYPNLGEETKHALRDIIPEAVTYRSKAELCQVVEYVKKHTYITDDYYSLTLLWRCLFMSEWFADQQLADTLLEDEKLQSCISLMSSSLAQYLIGNNMVQEVYRLMQTLLKYKFTDSFTIIMQMLFDHFCSKRERNRCSEIIKTSIELNTPLRQEQYDQFIAWSVNGDPYKLIKKPQIDKIYSTFL